MALCIMILEIVSLLEDLLAYLACIPFLLLYMLEVLLLSTAMDNLDVLCKVELGRYVLVALGTFMLAG